MQRQATFQVQTHKTPNKMNIIKNSLVAVALLGTVASSNAAIYYSQEVYGSPISPLDNNSTNVYDAGDLSGGEFTRHDVNSWNTKTFKATLTELFTGIDFSSVDITKAVIMFGFADLDSSDYKDQFGKPYPEGNEYVSAKAGSDNQQLALEKSPIALSYDLDVDLEGSTDTLVEVDGRHPGTGEDYHNTYDYREAELGDTAIEDIENSGELKFEVTSGPHNSLGSGSVYLKTVQVKIETTSVPDNGTTLALLGSALAGLVFLRRKIR